MKYSFRGAESVFLFYVFRREVVLSTKLLLDSESSGFLASAGVPAPPSKMLFCFRNEPIAFSYTKNWLYTCFGYFFCPSKLWSQSNKISSFWINALFPKLRPFFIILLIQESTHQPAFLRYTEAWKHFKSWLLFFLNKLLQNSSILFKQQIESDESLCTLALKGRLHFQLI